MNIKRRRQITKIKNKIDGFCQELEDIQSDEQSAFDNMLEVLKQGERGEQSEEAVRALEAAKGSLDEALDQLDTATQV